MIIKRGVLWSLVVICIITILSLSGDTADISRKKSRAVLDKIEPAVEKIEKNINGEIDRNLLHFYIRKNAHLFSYMVLGLLFSFAWRSYGLKPFNCCFISWLSALLISVVDECYQNFIPGRSGELRDVLIDNVGAILGITIGWIFYSLYNKEKKH